LRFAKKVVVTLAMSLLVLQSAVAQAGFASTYEQFPVSSGVKYKENKEVINTYDQSIKVLEVNLQDPYTRLDVSIPELGKISGTTAQAKAVHLEGNRVVGAINGSFFDTKTKLPMYLIAQNDILVNSGIIASGRDQYVNEPIAFGINAGGKAQIEYFDLDLTASHNGTVTDITSMNKIRNNDNLILYTPDYLDGYTNTNQYGYEVIFTGASKNKDLAFGDVITGTVSAKREYASTTNTNSQIPADGFVLSAHGEQMEFLKNMQVGEQVSISINIDDKWKGSKYILASGPRLVDNGAVSLSIDPNSSRARERAPRTAIAVDRTMTKVFMVTVDGRAEGYSKGMNLTEFAQYLVKLGAYKALNLDGGGSTTMLARKHGDDMASLINRPSDGWERAVSTTLQAISTAPLGQEASFGVGLSSSAVVVGSTISVSLKYVLDQFYNPLAKDPAKLKLSSTLGSFEGNTLKTTKVGDGVIVATYGNLKKEIPIKVKSDSPFIDIPSTSQYYSITKYLYDRDVIAGYSDGKYRPANTLKRIDAALLLVRSLKLDTSNIQDVNFVDVPKTYRFYKEVAAITNAGIISGKQNGTLFDPNAPLTRAEMAVILQKGFKLEGSAETPFTDVPEQSFAYNAISSLYANKITEGYGTLYKPADTVTRIQYAIFLYRALQNQQQ
jgi:hypothetical protein